MLKSVLDYLEQSAVRFPDKAAYIDKEKSITFGALRSEARRLATVLLRENIKGCPVPVLMPKSVDCITAFLAVRYAGGFYVPIDHEAPPERIRKVLSLCRSSIMISKQEDPVSSAFTDTVRILYTNECLRAQAEADDAAIDALRARQIDTDPIYAIFTSGSTGLPKGVVISERSAVNFTEWYCETFAFTPDDIFANQTPFFFDASVKDIYATLRCGCTMHIVPKKLFSLPVQLVGFLNEHRVTCIDWVPSVLCMIVNFKTFRKVKPRYLRQVMFLGEVMPTKQFNMWKEALPDVSYANLYGPTEATGDCTFYKVNRTFADDEPIPIGNACDNTEVFLLDENGALITDDTPGEICVRGCSLALGYYDDLPRTDEVFTQNPFRTEYRERIYHTGDIGKYNSYGEIVYLSRKDAQIKHLGHRIELGEIETAIRSLPGIRLACCLYQKDPGRIVACYEGEADPKEISAALKNLLPRYMLPGLLRQLKHIPLNPNGKTDRNALSVMLAEKPDGAPKEENQHGRTNP